MNSKNYSVFSILLILALLVSMLAVLVPAMTVQAAATSVTITGPTASSKAYIKPGGSISVTYTLAGTAPDCNVLCEVYSGSTKISIDNTQSHAPGASYTDTVPIETGATVGSYDLKVRVLSPVLENIVLGAVVVESTAPSVTLNIPSSASIYWKANTANTISYTVTDNYPGAITINAQYTLDGTTWNTLAGLNGLSVAQGTNTFSWTTPNEDSDKCKVQIMATDVAGNVSSWVPSANSFTLIKTAPTLLSFTPAGGSGVSYNGGSICSITYTSGSVLSPTLDYLYQYSANSGGAWTDIASYQLSQTKGDKTYNWSIPTSLAGTAYRVRVTARDKAGNTTTGGSTADFTIVNVTAPTVTISAPGAGARWYADSTTNNIAWTATSPVTGTMTYLLQYRTSSTDSWHDIVTLAGQPQGSRTHTWNPVPTPDATYTTCQVQVKATDTAGNFASNTSSNFTIVVDTTAPVVTVSPPVAGATWPKNSSQTVTWNATDNEAGNLLIKVELCDEGGVTFPYTIANLPNQAQGSGSYTYAVQSFVTAGVNNGQIRVTATDLATNSGVGTSGLFSITSGDTGATYKDITSLKADWNLVSLPLIPTSSNIESVLNEIIDNVVYVWYYNPSTGQWQTYAPGAPPDLTTMEAGKAYWIKLNADEAHWYVNGRKCPAAPGVPPTYNFAAGWNLVGFKSTDATTSAGTYLTGAAHSMIYKYDTAPAAYVPVTDVTNLVPGAGYWVYFPAAATVNPGCN